MALTMIAGSVAYVYCPIVASVDLDSQTVEVAVYQNGDSPSWEAATWEGDEPNTTRRAKVLVGPLTVGNYNVRSRITDSPEIPILRHDTIKVIE